MFARYCCIFFARLSIFFWGDERSPVPVLLILFVDITNAIKGKNRRDASTTVSLIIQMQFPARLHQYDHVIM